MLKQSQYYLLVLATCTLLAKMGLGFAPAAVWSGRGCAHQQCHDTTTSRTFGPVPRTSVRTTTRQFLLGGLFGDDNKKTEDDGELALYPIKSNKFESLAEYIQQWAGLFEGKGMGLTTPVTIRPVSSSSAKGVQILFVQVNTGYKDKDAAKDKDKKDDDYTRQQDDNKKQQEQVKQGGVEVLVEKLPDDSVQVRARRCEMDDDTMIKEMSEETILKELKEALDVWKKQQ